MITKVYKDYFQKSSVFLWPLLGIQSKEKNKPLETYISWSEQEDRKPKVLASDHRLILLYENTSTEFKKFEETFLLSHPLLDGVYKGEDNEVIYVFNMSHVEEDYEIFLKGEYSKMSDTSKKMILKYHGEKTKVGEYILTFLYPEKYHQTYADLLDLDVEIVKEIGQLCDPYNPDKEHLVFSTIEVIKSQ